MIRTPRIRLRQDDSDGGGRPLILVLDHYDSFTFNLVQLIEALGAPTEVVRSDAEPAEALVAREPDAVVLSPGPGRPEDAGCFLELLDILPHAVPVLGVCLGHQALAVAAGGRVERGKPMHGKTTLVHHDERGIFAGRPSPFEAARYHSLVITTDDLPPEMELTAWSDDGLVMAAQHQELPRFGVQFHPESILTPEGPAIVRTFLELARAGATEGSRPPSRRSSSVRGPRPERSSSGIRRPIRS